jgi:predicted alpha/beta superfamily hydrolase
MPTPTLARAERFQLPSAHTRCVYAISLYRPGPSPFTGAPADCPIVVVLDGAMTFGTAVESTELRSAVGQLRPAVIVGVAHDTDVVTATRLRSRDFTPPTPSDKYPELAPLIGTEYGAADSFLEFLTQELLPDIRARAPEASATQRVLFGHSLAGVFVAHVLLKRPTAFTTYVASSPSLWWNEFAVLRSQSGFRERVAGHEAGMRVLLTVASAEQDPPTQALPGIELSAAQERVRQARMIDAAREFSEWLSSFKLSQVEFVCFEGEDHGSVIAAALSRGLTFALRINAA